MSILSTEILSAVNTGRAGTIRLVYYRLPDIATLSLKIVTKLKSVGITGLLKHHEYKWHLTMQKSLVSYIAAI